LARRGNAAAWQYTGEPGARSDISACDRGVCSDHHNDNDDVGFKVVVNTLSGITLFQTQGALIFVILYGTLESNVIHLTAGAHISTCGGVVGSLVSVVQRLHMNISGFGVFCLSGFCEEREETVENGLVTIFMTLHFFHLSPVL
jgi:hypothetical protein